METIRIKSKDLEKELRVGDIIVALSGYDVSPYEVVELHPGRAIVKRLDFPNLNDTTLFYNANQSVTVERADYQED